MSNNNYNLATNKPLIPNANQYFSYKQYVLINSEDRNISRYPDAADFEIELPTDYANVSTARIYSWSFPSVFSTFAPHKHNVSLAFKIPDPYVPVPGSNTLNDGISDALLAHANDEYVIYIESGYYSPTQMATELTNKLNAAVTAYITQFFADNQPLYDSATDLFTGYDRFVVAYNSVSMDLWFGNRADKFELTNDSNVYNKITTSNSMCMQKNVVASDADWGLPAHLGFLKQQNNTSMTVAEINSAFGNVQPNQYLNALHASIDQTALVPRFFYEKGAAGFWISTNIPNASIYFLNAPTKVAMLGDAHFYIEIDKLNCIDETVPYKMSQFTQTTNQTNSIVNSAFAKIPISDKPIAYCFNEASYGPYKMFNPPTDMQRKLKVKMRYHNGMLVDFGNNPYSFMIELTTLVPNQERVYNITSAF